MATRVEYEFDPFDLTQTDTEGLDPSTIKQAVDEVADYVYQQVVTKTSGQESPVTGEGFEPLSKEYADRKRAMVGNTKANLILSGDLIDSVKVIKRGATRLTLTVGANEQGKADGHNNFSGQSKLPERKFIPNASLGETFSPDIVDGITSILNSYVEQKRETQEIESIVQDRLGAKLEKIVKTGLQIKLQTIVDDILGD